MISLSVTLFVLQQSGEGVLKTTKLAHLTLQQQS